MSGRSGKGIASSLSKAFNTLKPQLKQFSSELSTTAKQIGAQQLQAASTAYLQQYAPPTAVGQMTAKATPSVATAQAPAPTLTQSLMTPLVENIIRASQMSSVAVATSPAVSAPAVSAPVVVPSVTPATPVPAVPQPPQPIVKMPEIVPGVSLKPGIVAETIQPSLSGNVTHAILKDITPKPFYKKTWFIVAIILILILIAVAIGLTIFIVVRNRDKKKQEEK